jgi:hypothetical protein
VTPTCYALSVALVAGGRDIVNPVVFSAVLMFNRQNRMGFHNRLAVLKAGRILAQGNGSG